MRESLKYDGKVKQAACHANFIGQFIRITHLIPLKAQDKKINSVFPH